MIVFIFIAIYFLAGFVISSILYRVHNDFDLPMEVFEQCTFIMGIVMWPIVIIANGSTYLFAKFWPGNIIEKYLKLIEKK